MKKKKSVLHKVLVVSLAASMLACTSFTAVGSYVGTSICVSAAETLTYGDFEYELDSYGGVAITKYTGNGREAVIPDTIDGKSVNTIRSSAFSDCPNLTSIIVGTSNRYYCSDKGVLLDKHKTTLICCPQGKTGEYVVPEKVTQIFGSAFKDCTGLTSVKLSDKVTNVGSYTFAGCTGLTSIKIPEGVGEIYTSAFEGCTALTSIELPDSLTHIYGSAFEGCTDLTSIELPDSLTYIGDYAFFGCTGLTSINIPDSVTEIGIAAFHSCSGLTSINIPAAVTEIGNQAFYDCSALTSIDVSEDNEYYFSDDGVLLDKEKTTIICCPQGKTGGYTIPNSVGKISSHAFYGCSALTSIVIHNGMTSIDSFAFEGCSGLTSIKIPNRVRKIDMYAFYGCTGLKSIELPVSVREIGSYAFYYCTSLTTAAVPDSVISIGDGAFDDYTDLTIYGAEGSSAETYANENDIPFVSVNGYTNVSTISADEIVLGGTVTVNAKAVFGKGDYTYAVFYKKKTDTKWTTKQDFGKNDTVTIKPAHAVVYDVCVKVKDSSGKIVKRYFEVKVNAKLANTSTISAENITLGQKVTVNGLAQGGSGNYTYAVLYKKTTDTNWATLQNYSANATVTFKPSKAVKYDIYVKVKDSTGTVEKKYFTVNVVEKLINSSSVSSDSIYLGDTVKITGKASGGTGGYTYAVLYKKTDDTKWATLQNYSTTASVNFKPSKAVKYDIYVKVKDSNGTVEKKYFTVDVKEPLENTSTVSADTIKVGETVDITCAAAGGMGSYTYAVLYKKSTDTNWATIQNYSTNTNVSIKLSKAVRYDIYVKVKDSSGTVAKKNFTVDVTA